MFIFQLSKNLYQSICGHEMCSVVAFDLAAVARMFLYLRDILLIVLEYLVFFFTKQLLRHQQQAMHNNSNNANLLKKDAVCKNKPFLVAVTTLTCFSWILLWQTSLLNISGSMLRSDKWLACVRWKWCLSRSQYPLKSSTDQNCTKTEAPNIEASRAVFVEIANVSIKTSQELGMLSRSSLTVKH